MEANVLRKNMISTLTSTHYDLFKHKPQHPPSIVCVLKRPSNHDIPNETTKHSTNVYKDSWFDLLAINHLSKSVQAATGSFHTLLPLSCNLFIISRRKCRLCNLYPLQDLETIRVAMRVLLRQLL